MWTQIPFRTDGESPVLFLMTEVEGMDSTLWPEPPVEMKWQLEESWWSGSVSVCQQCQRAAELTGQRVSEQHQQKESIQHTDAGDVTCHGAERTRAVSRTDVHHTLKICIRISGGPAQTGSKRLKQAPGNHPTVSTPLMMVWPKD